jgi:hypothetical protein
MTAPESPEGKKPPGGGDTALTGVDRLFGRDLRSQGWVLKLGMKDGRAAGPATAAESAPETPSYPAMLWALRWRRK